MSVCVFLLGSVLNIKISILNKINVVLNKSENICILDVYLLNFESEKLKQSKNNIQQASKLRHTHKTEMLF